MPDVVGGGSNAVLVLPLCYGVANPRQVERASAGLRVADVPRRLVEERKLRESPLLVGLSRKSLLRREVATSGRDLG